MRGTEKAVVMVLTLTIALLVGHPSLKILLASITSDENRNLASHPPTETGYERV